MNLREEIEELIRPGIYGGQLRDELLKLFKKYALEVVQLKQDNVYGSKEHDFWAEFFTIELTKKIEEATKQ